MLILTLIQEDRFFQVFLVRIASWLMSMRTK